MGKNSTEPSISLPVNLQDLGSKSSEVGKLCIPDVSSRDSNPAKRLKKFDLDSIDKMGSNVKCALELDKRKGGIGDINNQSSTHDLIRRNELAIERESYHKIFQ